MAVFTWSRNELSDRRVLELLDLAAALAIPRVREVFKKALTETLTPQVRSVFNSALRSGDIEAALSSIPWETFSGALEAVYGPGGPLVAMFGSGGDLAARLIMPLIPGGESGLPLAFEDYAPHAIEYLRDRGAKLVTLVTEQTREALRGILETAFSEPASIDDTARAIRDVLMEVVQGGGLVGINTRQAAALENYIETLVEDSDLSAQQIQQLVDRRFRKMVKERASMIARTEVYNAGNQGMVGAWKRLKEDGRVRIVGLEDEFVSDLGERVRAPEIHPNGYCTQRLVRIGQQDGVPIYAREWVTRVVGVCKRCVAFDGKRALPATNLEEGLRFVEAEP